MSHQRLTCVLYFLILIFEFSTGEEIGLAEDDFLYDIFPEDFKFGFATASYQIEGAWDEDGKGENIWDHFTHQEVSPIFDNSTGDIACDSYHKYPEDVQLLKSLGANYYRFSVSWSRILPNGTLAGGVNSAGLDYYNRLITELIDNNIEPMITLYHWDLPQALEDIGGFLNSDLEKHFGDYARLLFGNFGDRVKLWITFNEPWVQCELGYGQGVNAPGVHDPPMGAYLCGHNLLKAHATAYHIYNSEFKPVQKGQIGITLDSAWYEPLVPGNPDFEAAAERALLFKQGWFAFPVFFGDYPAVMRQLVDSKSRQEGRNESRLPAFDSNWSSKIKGSYDFLGLNHYTTEYAYPANSSDSSWFGDQNIGTGQDPDWEASASSWLKRVPWGFRKLLNWIKNTYGNPTVLITENGWSDTLSVGLNDEKREIYYNLYINEVLKAIKLDGCDVRAYTAWSILDNFEWARGYTERFGLHWVNFTDPERPRTPKQSTNLLKQIISDHGYPKP